MQMLPTAGVFAGVTAYTWQDVNFTVVGYVWIIIWYTFAVFEMVYVKKVVDTVKMTTWSRTYYQVITGPQSFSDLVQHLESLLYCLTLP